MSHELFWWTKSSKFRSWLTTAHVLNVFVELLLLSGELTALYLQTLDSKKGPALGPHSHAILENHLV